MASCAVCMQPILRSQAFVLDGTEGMHRSCAGAAYRSKARLAEATIARLEQELAAERRTVTTTRAAAVVARSVSRQAEGTIEGLRAQLDLAQERQRAQQMELQAARNQNITLRAELAKAQASSTATASRTTSSSESAGTGEVIDEGAARFALLEMDHEET